jgi:hypothetical protein
MEVDHQKWDMETDENRVAAQDLSPVVYEDQDQRRRQMAYDLDFPESEACGSCLIYQPANRIIYLDKRKSQSRPSLLDSWRGRELRSKHGMKIWYTPRIRTL